MSNRVPVIYNASLIYKSGMLHKTFLSWLLEWCIIGSDSPLMQLILHCKDRFSNK